MSINRFFRLTYIIVKSLQFHIVTIVERAIWRLCGVTLGKNVRFSGWCRLTRYEHSQIAIGHHVHFVSSPFVNHIGLNRSCSLATETPEAEIRIGDYCGFSSTSIISFKSVIIGNHVRVGANTVIMDGDFHLDDYRTTPATAIQIDDNVWIGANVVVMKGVHIGANTIIGMNSVVTKDVPADCVAAGIPCKVIRKI